MNVAIKQNISHFSFLDDNIKISNKRKREGIVADRLAVGRFGQKKKS